MARGRNSGVVRVSQTPTRQAILAVAKDNIPHYGFNYLGVAQKLTSRGYAGVGSCCHLPGFHFGIPAF